MLLQSDVVDQMQKRNKHMVEARTCNVVNHKIDFSWFLDLVLGKCFEQIYFIFHIELFSLNTYIKMILGPFHFKRFYVKLFVYFVKPTNRISHFENVFFWFTVNIYNVWCWVQQFFSINKINMFDYFTKTQSADYFVVVFQVGASVVMWTNQHSSELCRRKDQK